MSGVVVVVSKNLNMYFVFHRHVAPHRGVDLVYSLWTYG